MKFLRYGSEGEEKPGFLDENGRIRDLSSKVNDLKGDSLNPDRLAAFSMIDPNTLPIVEGTVRFGVPVSGIGKIIAVGLNYADHAKETNNPIPQEPVLFSKAITSLNGPNDNVSLPKNSKKCDWEVELAIIIGRKTQYISETNARDNIAGFAIANDISERSFQLERGGQWLKGKSFDTFCPLGPWLVTPDEINDPQNLGIWLEVNGKRFQNGNTRTMIFDVYQIVSYISEFMTLMPGDVIITGTPPGVGLGQSPEVFLKNGDEITLGIEGLGEQKQKVLAFS